MKTRYLAYGEIEGARTLAEISGAEWYEIIKANKNLPEDKKRWFIRDIIIDGPDSDVLMIEVTHAEYKQWRCEQQRRRRRCAYSNAFVQISIDVCLDGAMPLHEIFSSVPSAEREYFEDNLTHDLFLAAAEWRPWAPALLLYCMSGNSWRSATSWLADYLGVCIRTARKNKTEFEEFIKDFLF